jgi:hypothetical protein
MQGRIGCDLEFFFWEPAKLPPEVCDRSEGYIGGQVGGGYLDPRSPILRSVDLWRCRQVRCHAAAQPAPVVRLGAPFLPERALGRLELRCAFLAPLVRMGDLALTIAGEDVVYLPSCAFAARGSYR